MFLVSPKMISNRYVDSFAPYMTPLHDVYKNNVEYIFSFNSCLSLSPLTNHQIFNYAGFDQFHIQIFPHFTKTCKRGNCFFRFFSEMWWSLTATPDYFHQHLFMHFLQNAYQVTFNTKHQLQSYRLNYLPCLEVSLIYFRNTTPPLPPIPF